MHGIKLSKNPKAKTKKSPSSKKNHENNNSNSTIIINELESSINFKENKILSQIFTNRLHPPPIGTFSKELNFETNLNFNTLYPVIKNNQKMILGEGSFSIVQLYEDKKTKIKYAVKKMNSEKIEKISKNKKLINTEVNIHGRINHPNIIKLHNFFKIKNICYLILEYASDGTLFDIIRSKRGLSETYSFYYFLQTLNAIYFLHLHSIINRDLKPENLLINEKNIIKLCDFGWSVKLKDNKRTTFCGTVEYMAPEIIKKEKYDESIDVWSLGVLLYELVHSYSPFFSEDLDAKKIGNNITNNNNLKFKDGLSDEYKNLVESLLVKDSNKRIKIEDIFQHPFMTKYINMIYIEVKNNNNNNDNSSNKSGDNNNTIKIPENIINKKNEHFNKNKIKKINKQNTDNNIDNSNNLSNFKDNDMFRETNTNAIFESIPNEPIPKILPEPNLYYNEIKKIKTNYYNINKQTPEINSNINSDISPDKYNDAFDKKIKKENKIFKNQKIAHVKSFSLGQNDPTFKDLNENRLKIIISINNTQNKNYINKNKNRNKSKKLYSGHKKSLSNFIQDNYLGYNSNLDLDNKIDSLNPLQRSINLENDNKIIHINSKYNKNVNHVFLTENKSELNYNNKPNKKILYHDFNSNYIKTDNDPRYQYISMINHNNTNNYSNIIINNNGNNPNYKKNVKNRGLKITKSNYKDLKYLCRVNSDSNQLLLNNSNIKHSDTNNIIYLSTNKKNKKQGGVFKNKKIFQSSIDNIHKNVKVSFIDKILNNNNRSLSPINNKSEMKNENNSLISLKKNFDSMKNHINFDVNIQNSNKKGRIEKK